MPLILYLKLGDELVNQFLETCFLISNYKLSSYRNAESSERWNIPLGAGSGSLINAKK